MGHAELAGARGPGGGVDRDHAAEAVPDEHDVVVLRHAGLVQRGQHAALVGRHASVEGEHRGAQVGDVLRRAPAPVLDAGDVDDDPARAVGHRQHPHVDLAVPLVVVAPREVVDEVGEGARRPARAPVDARGHGDPWAVVAELRLHAALRPLEAEGAQHGVVEVGIVGERGLPGPRRAAGAEQRRLADADPVGDTSGGRDDVVADACVGQVVAQRGPHQRAGHGRALPRREVQVEQGRPHLLVGAGQEHLRVEAGRVQGAQPGRHRAEQRVPECPAGVVEGVSGGAERHGQVHQVGPVRRDAAAAAAHPYRLRAAAATAHGRTRMA